MTLLHESPRASLWALGDTHLRVMVGGSAHDWPLRGLSLRLYNCAEFRKRGGQLRADADDRLIMLCFYEGRRPLLAKGPLEPAEAGAIQRIVDLFRQSRLIYSGPPLRIWQERDGYRIHFESTSGRGYTLDEGLLKALFVETPWRAFDFLKGAGDSGVRFDLTTGESWSLGPLPIEQTRAVMEAFLKYTRPAQMNYRDVTEQALLATPVQFDGQRIRVTGRWSLGMENSTFAGAWFHPLARFRRSGGPPESVSVSVEGLWRYSSASPGRGFGHLGHWPGELRAEAMELLGSWSRTH